MSDAPATRSSGIGPDCTWAPAFPGQRRPFPKGHTFSTVSGVYSERVLGPLAAEIEQELLNDPYRPYLAQPILADMVRAYARNEARLQIAQEHLDAVGWPFEPDDDQEGEPPRIPLWRRRLAAYQVWNRAQTRQISLMHKLGMTPLAQATAPEEALWKQAERTWYRERLKASRGS